MPRLGRGRPHLPLITKAVLPVAAGGFKGYWVRRALVIGDGIYIMYPKNAASPEPVAIGAVVQISDGAVQTSGCTVRIKPIGVAEGDGGGTTAYSTDGIVLYTPTQAETNYTSFILIAKKTGCIPVSVTVVTTGSATAGHAAIDWGVVANKTTTNALTGTTIATTQKVDIETIKTQTVTCGAGVTVLASVGTAATSTAQTGDSYALANGSAGFVAIDTVVDAIKVKTDSLTFTVANVLDANMLRLGGTVQTARDIGASVLLSSGTGTGQLDFTSGIVKGNVTQYNGATTLVTRLTTIFSTSYATVFDNVNAVLNANVTHINSTASSAVALDGMAATYDSALGLPCSGYTAAGITDLQTGVNARFVAYGLDHLVSASVTGTDIVDNSIIARLVSKSATADWDTYDQTTDSHEALRDRGDAAWTTATGFSTLSQADIRTAVGLASANLDTQIGTLATAANLATVAGYLDTEIAAILADTNELQTDWADGGRLDLIVDSILVDTAEIGAAGAGLTALATQSSVNTIDDFLDTEVAAIKAKTDNLPSDPADQSAVEAAILAAWTTALTESYSADGAAPTPAQALMLIMQRLTEFAISGTTVTIKKLDGSTTAGTLTLNDATSPTSSTRAT